MGFYGEVKRARMTGLVALHFLVTAWHGYTHKRLAVTLPPEKDAFVFIVIVLAPIVAAVLLWTRLGAYHHYVLVSPDHVQHLPSGSAEAQSAFITSAAALTLIELASALYGAFCVRALRGRAAAERG